MKAPTGAGTAWTGRGDGEAPTAIMRPAPRRSRAVRPRCG